MRIIAKVVVAVVFSVCAFADSITISGRVYDEATGTGVQGVAIRVFPTGSSDDLMNVQGQTQTVFSDGSGHYKTTQPLDPAEYFIVPRRVPGFLQKDAGDRTTVMLKAGENLEGIDFPLSKGVSISGTVRDPENKTVSGIRIMAGAERSEPQHAVSNDAGAFEITGFLPGAQIQVSVWMNEGFAGMTVGTWSLPEGGLQDVKVVLVAESTIEGRVVDNDGNPVSRRPIYMGGKRPDGGFTVSGLPHHNITSNGGVELASSASDGSYKLSGLAPGTYRVSVPQPAEMEKAKVVEVGRGEHVKGIELLYHVPGLTISGRITDPQGRPVAGAQVESWGPWNNSGPQYAVPNDAGVIEMTFIDPKDPTRGSWAGRTTTNADGRYVLEGLEEGVHRLQVLAPRRWPADVPHDWKSEERLGVQAGAEDVDFVLTPESTI